jgi:hypothetical protein
MDNKNIKALIATLAKMDGQLTGSTNAMSSMLEATNRFNTPEMALVALCIEGFRKTVWEAQEEISSARATAEDVLTQICLTQVPVAPPVHCCPPEFEPAKTTDSSPRMSYQDLLDAIRIKRNRPTQGWKIPAIKSTRDRIGYTAIGLKDAKELVENTVAAYELAEYPLNPLLNLAECPSGKNVHTIDLDILQNTDEIRKDPEI